eukprot:TRINITY_DN3752_c0_g1_i1.p1 TRINITY_DN3752_c0_g1~~TRINITY_DN3752_c0_g1_i1.p1  ORF type:complete len:471 (-),score=159.12 TRINITY_DN3752_c0_g1_i1:54-1442(-)
MNTSPGKKKLTIAINGCTHGELDIIYDTLKMVEQKEGKKVDLFISCGDFQSVRNQNDLFSLSCPVKYKHMNTFYKYYSGEKEAPYLTLFIGGNHEASNYLRELFYGGWVAPKIYYLGATGVVNIGGLRIGGMSGIFKHYDFHKGYHETFPLNKGHINSIYHIRNFDIFKLNQLSGKMDIMISHDWPEGIYDYGNKEELLRIKKNFIEDVQKNELGSPHSFDLLKSKKPSYWFSGHLHVLFPAIYKHEEENIEKKENSENMKEEKQETQKEIKKTKFLGIDKVIPNRKFLQIIELEIDENEDKLLRYDVEWLAITKSTHHLMSFTQNGPSNLDISQQEKYVPTKSDLEKISLLLDGNTVIPYNFKKTLPSHMEQPFQVYEPYNMNPQTQAFLDLLKIDTPSPALISNTTPVFQQQYDDFGVPINLIQGDNNPNLNFIENNVNIDDNNQLNDQSNPEEINLDDL